MHNTFVKDVVSMESLMTGYPNGQTYIWIETVIFDSL